MLADPAWRDWYRAQHDRRCALLTGSAYEDHITDILARFHPDFINPTPAGRLGDAGSDGLAESGTILYACYGSRAQQDAERKLAAKIQGDFARGLASWDTFVSWRFVTNASPGPVAAKALTEIQQAHGPSTLRPIEAMIWGCDRVWTEVVSNLAPSHLNEIFPGVPRAENIDLADLIPLLDELGQDSDYREANESINTVSVEKMNFNRLAPASQIEFNEGRLMSPRIDKWFAEQSNPDLRDHQARNFRTIYENHKLATTDATEILERIYTSIGGSDFRHDSKRANSVYAISAYFFDSCDIFDEPPPGWMEGS
ncbi:ABC-three component system protein [Mycobacterium sp. E3298]|uniref:ABC-three component system protein n=1 Tax=Mycobacterium sp. E3298 TaxID=1856865 RepID=UPI000A93E8A9|nr:ABC-three component system protein [Mycobacterium sp. E3298]